MHNCQETQSLSDVCIAFAVHLTLFLSCSLVKVQRSAPSERNGQLIRVLFVTHLRCSFLSGFEVSVDAIVCSGHTLGKDAGH